ncbi:energy-coupling factor ABC transporter permease [Paraglaciecola sp.]|uniref:energy-coupling factor ABC transporter permease n=1 Tax=Paraglaciecola sp. TaxID=1920173 RepID=UPI003EF6B987
MTSIQIMASLLSCILAYCCFKNLSLQQLKSDKKVQHLIFGSTAAIFILWMFRTGTYPGLTVHFLWLSTLPLLLGFRWSVLSASLALLGVTILGEENFNLLGINFLLGVLLPISVTYGLYTLIYHVFPKQPYLYLFVCGFLCGALAIGMKMLALSGYYYLDGVHSWHTISENYLNLTSYLLMPEAMFNGMTLVVLVIHKPQWVYTFYTRFSFEKK